MYDTKIEKSVTVEVPAEDVWKLLTDPNKIPLIMPSLIENTDVPELPLKDGSEFSYKYQMYGVILEGKVVVSSIKSPTEYSFKTNGDVESEWKYVLKDNGGSSTDVSLTVSYKQPENVLQKVKSGVVAKMNQKEADLFLDNLKTVLESKD